MCIRRLFLLCAVLAACNKDAGQPAAADGYSSRMAQQQQEQVKAAPDSLAETAPSVRTQSVEYATIKNRAVTGYLAYPAHAEGGLPAVLVFHGWRGLDENTKIMSRQLASQGYVALAVDLFLGEEARQPDEARRLVEKTLADQKTLDEHLRQAQSFLDGEIKATRIGALGWSLGGTVSLRSGLVMADQLDAVAIYYGQVTADPARLKPLAAPLLGIFGDDDERIPLEEVRAFEQTLQMLGKRAEIHIYEDAAHAFADPSGGNYKADAAADAWAKTLAFLAAHLVGS